MIREPTALSQFTSPSQTTTELPILSISTVPPPTNMHQRMLWALMAV
jgi:hypothetical protein